MKARHFILITLFYLTTSPLFAQDNNYSNEFGFKSDNDSYLAQGQDQYYTNGIFIYFRHAIDQGTTDDKKTIKKTWQAELGQKMYNAQSGYVPDITYVDRPFAAYLYAAGSYNWFYKSENILKVSLQVGTVGPNAKGKEAQELLHDTFGFYEINGWQWQVNNEVGINSVIEYDHFIHRSKSNKVDFSASSYINAGNTFAGAGVGILFRAGELNQFFKSASTNSRISNSSNLESIDREFLFYAKPSINFIAYDATVKGGLFTDDKGSITYDTKPVVFQQDFGVMYAKNRWTVDFSVIFKTKEIESSAKAHQYGSLKAFYRFN